MATSTLPDSPTEDTDNPGQDEFDKLIDKNISPGDERMMEERAKDGAIDDNTSAPSPLGQGSPKSVYDQPGDAPSPAKFDSNQLRRSEESGGSFSPGSSSSSTGRGHTNYASDKPSSPGPGGASSSSTVPGKLNYNSSGDVPPAEKSLYNASATKPGKTRLRSFFSSRRNQVIFGAGGVSTIAGLLIFFTLGSGPFEFIHIAQLLEGFHFSAQQDQSNDRTLQDFRWLRYKVSGRVERANLGYFQNYIADKLEARMNTAGVESVYNNAAFGPNGDGFILDPSKDIGQKLGIQGNSQDEIEQYFKDNYPGVKISFTDPQTGKAFDDGRFFVDMSNINSMIFTGHFKTVGLNRTFLKATDMNGITSYLSARIMARRAGATLHAITQQNLIDKSKGFIDFVKGWIKSSEDGTTQSINETGANDTSAQDEQFAEYFAKEGTDINVTPVSPGSVPDPEGTETSEGLSLKGAIAGGGLAALTVACTLRGIDNDATQIKEARVVYPLIREATTIIAVGNQVMSGQDLTAQQLGYFKQLLDGPSTQNSNPNAQTSWYQAQSIQAELGNSDTGIKPSNTLMDINKNSPFHFLNTGYASIVLGGTFGLCSEVAQIIGDVLSPGGALIGYIVSQFAPIKHLYDSAAQWAAGQPLNVLDRGADFGNDINFGARLAANSQAVSSGGRMLSSSESDQLALYEANQSQQEFDSHGLAYRLFNPYDDRSAISKLIDQQNPNTGQELHSVASALLNFGHIFASIPRFLTSTAHAAPVPYDYGFPQYGFSADEMDNPLVRNPYQNADDVVNTILPNHPEYIQMAQDCFGVTIDPNTYNITSLGNTQIDAGSSSAISMNFFQQPGAAGFNSACASTSSDWLQVRFYIFDTQNMESLACYIGDPSDPTTQQACDDIGNSAAETGSASSGSAAASGSNNSNGSSGGSPSAPTTQPANTCGYVNGAYKYTSGPQKGQLCPL